ncbi:ASCH domain-containing protein [Stutzerimonas frequens]|uniref:ASCH domain-containing protein n=1 Tax=Stutzerimonas frequens TaxID=2968969 RepID=UPI001AAE975E|nr:ASCH domain-containing protein [Stutzerimonas frequens]QTF59120.1 ASCH domain-containing protein [Stutzerimonas frequens]
MKALSIRQPWAWLIVRGHKPLENRSWATSYRGPLLIHAAKGMTRAEYEDAASLCSKAAITLPAFDALERGGIVGQATVTGCIDESPSLWFFGKYALQGQARSVRRGLPGINVPVSYIADTPIPPPFLGKGASRPLSPTAQGEKQTP